MVFWGIEVVPGKPHAEIPLFGDQLPCQLRVSQATLGLASSSSGRARLVVSAQPKGGPEIVVCSLREGTSECCSLDLVFDDEITFKAQVENATNEEPSSASRSVYLAGYFMPFEDEEEEEVPEHEQDEQEQEESADEPKEREEQAAGGDQAPDMKAMGEGAVAVARREGRQLASKVLSGSIGGKGEPGSEVTWGKEEEVGGEEDEEEEEDEDGFKQPRRKKVKGESSAAAASPSPAAPSAEGQQKPTTPSTAEEDPGVAASPAPAAATAGGSGVQRAKVKSKQGKAAAAAAAAGAVATPQTARKAGSDQAQGAAEGRGSKATPSPVAAEGGAAAVTPKSAQPKDTADGRKGSPLSNGKVSKKALPAVRRFPNGLEVHHMGVGRADARVAKQGKRVFMHYTGRLKSNGKMFDSSVGKKPFAFRLGVGEVIKGWDIGLAGMRVGDTRKLVIPPAMGYGADGVKNAIPGNAWLEFDVELVDVK